MSNDFILLWDDDDDHNQLENWLNKHLKEGERRISDRQSVHFHFFLWKYIFLQLICFCKSEVLILFALLLFRLPLILVTWLFVLQTFGRNGLYAYHIVVTISNNLIPHSNCKLLKNLFDFCYWSSLELAREEYSKRVSQ